MIFGSRNREALSDKDLVYRYQKTRNNEYMSELFNRYGHLVYGTCLKYLKDQDKSKDAVMKIFEKVMADLQRMKVAHFKSWLYMVSKNHCLMELRKKSPVNEGELPSNIEADNWIPDKILQEAKYEELEAAIDQLKPEQKECITEFYLNSKTYDQVAADTGFEVKKVKSYIQNGKRNLKIILSEAFRTKGLEHRSTGT